MEKKVYGFGFTKSEIIRVVGALIRDAEDCRQHGYSRLHREDLSLATDLLSFYNSIEED